MTSTNAGLLQAIDLEHGDDPSLVTRWNRFVATAEYGHLHQGYEYGLLRARLGWRPRFFWIERDGDICAGAMLLLRAIPACLSVGTIPGGPMWRPGHEQLIPGVLSAASAYCRRNHAIFCRVHPVCPPETLAPILPSVPERIKVLGSYWSYWNLPRVRMIIDIHGDPMDAMSPDARKKSRRGERRSVAIRRDGSELVPALVRLLRQMADRKSVLVRDEQYLHQLLTTYPSDSIAIFAAEAAGEIIAATLAVLAGCTAYELYRAFDYSKRNLYPNEALQVAVMKWAKEHGCLFYDMGGSCTSWPVRATDKGYGVYRFKRELGAQSIVSAPYVDLVYRPLLYCGCWLAENIGMPFVVEKGFGKFRVAFERVYENR